VGKVTVTHARGFVDCISSDFRRSNVGRAGVRSDDLPTVAKLLQVHGGVPHDLLFGIRKSDRPPSESKSEVRLEQFDLNAGGIDEAHGVVIRITVNIGIVKLLPAVKLLRINHHQQFR
jgi:hypothetical protein